MEVLISLPLLLSAYGSTPFAFLIYLLLEKTPQDAFQRVLLLHSGLSFECFTVSKYIVSCICNYSFFIFTHNSNYNMCFSIFWICSICTCIPHLWWRILIIRDKYDASTFIHTRMGMYAYEKSLIASKTHCSDLMHFSPSYSDLHSCLYSTMWPEERESVLGKSKVYYKQQAF